MLFGHFYLRCVSINLRTSGPQISTPRLQNRDLEHLVKEGSFREDLYHRLNVVAIKLPPLRERGEDIPVLANYFLRKYATSTRRIVNEIGEETQRKLAAYNWPGNVRELANVIERAIVLGSGSRITTEDLPGQITDRLVMAVPANLSYRAGVNEARKQLVRRALALTRGNRAAAAKVLGLEPKYLLKLIKSLGIE